MKKVVKIFSIIISIIFCCCFFSCKNPTSSIDLYHFNTQIHLTTRTTQISDKQQIQIEKLFSSLENEFSADEKNSIVNSFNQLDVGQSIKVSKIAKEVISLSKNCYDFSEEKFNPTVFPLVKLWSFYPNYPVLNFSPPSEDEILTTISQFSTDYNSLQLDVENSTINKKSQCQIDLGGIVKGYALDQCAKLLKDFGHKDGYISIGSSSIYILGADTLGIKHPEQKIDIPNIISINIQGQNNLFVSTSGDYQRTYTHGGKNYSHIIDSKTGKPTSTGITSATIISDKISGGMLDGLSTALCLCNHSIKETDTELLNLLKKINLLDKDCKLFVAFEKDANKIILTNQKQGENFTLLDDSYKVINLNV